MPKRAASAKAKQAPKKTKVAKPQPVFERSSIPRVPIPDNIPNTRIISWNVNGLRAVCKNNLPSLLNLVEVEKPDLLCLQETKLQDTHLKDFTNLVPGYKSFWSCSTAKKGYAGTAVFVKKEMAADVNVSYGIGFPEHDKEGRSITVEFPSFFALNLYVPNSGMKLDRLDYRTKTWDRDLMKYVKQLESKGKPVCFLGDLNVAHQNEDIYNFDAKHIPKTAGCTKAERESFTKMLEQGFVDTFRHANPDAEHAYTYWSVRAGNRPFNKGLRLDYMVCSESMVKPEDEREPGQPFCRDQFILDKITEGVSDHCPVGVDVGITPSEPVPASEN